MTTQLDRIEGKVDRALLLLEGNGKPERGLVVRVDRLEQSEKRRARWVGAFGTAMIASLAGTLWGFLRGAP